MVAGVLGFCAHKDVVVLAVAKDGADGSFFRDAEWSWGESFVHIGVVGRVDL